MLIPSAYAPRAARAAFSICFALASLLAATAVVAQIPDYYREPGRYPTRDYVNQHFGEHIDPFTGMVQLHFVDAFLPGPGGMDIKVQRSYNSQSLSSVGELGARSTTGVGWTMHFGRVIRFDNFCGAGFAGTSRNSVLELPDGSRRILFENTTTVTGSNPRYWTLDRWKAECNASATGMSVWSPEGVRYDMTFRAAIGTGVLGQQEVSYQATRITDRNGNAIDIAWRTSTQGFPLIASVRASDGRQLTYAYLDEAGASPRIDSITTDTGASWRYQYQPAPNDATQHYLLTRVETPEGRTWSFDYNGLLTTGQAGSYALARLTRPEGGSITYDYQHVAFDPQQAAIRSAAIQTKRSSDGGTWTYAFQPGTSFDQTTVQAPDATYTYQHFGYGAATSGTLWKIGALLRKQIGNLQTEELTWASQVISSQQYLRPTSYGGTRFDPDTRAPLLVLRRITRDGTLYQSTYSDFDAFGNPRRISQSGQATWSASLTWLTDTSRWIVRQAQDETNSAGSITRTWDGNANLASETRYAASKA